MTPFEQTLELISIKLNLMLNKDYYKINVQGCNTNNITTLVFTIFNKFGYNQEFLTFKNFKLYKESGDPNIENSFIDKHIQTTKSVLNKYLNE